MSRKKFYEEVLMQAHIITKEEHKHFNNIVECIEFVTSCFINEIVLGRGEFKEAWALNLEHDLLNLNS